MTQKEDCNREGVKIQEYPYILSVQAPMSSKGTASGDEMKTERTSTT